MRTRRLLLVEDCKAEQRLMTEAWNTVCPDVCIQTADTAEEALRQLMHRQCFGGSLPQLVLLDVNLPGRSGFDVLAYVKTHAELRVIPVMIVSTLQSPDMVNHAYRLQANGYIPKPDSWERYLQMVSCMDRFWFQTVRLPYD